MPQVAAAWGLSGIWAAVVGYTLEVAVAAAASYAATKLTADNFDTGFNLDTQTSGNQIPIRVVYGIGTMAGVEAFKSSARVDNDNFDLHYALVLAGHECEDITDVWLDETFAAAGVDLDWSNNRIGGGKFDPDGTHNACHFWKHLGTSTQTVDAELNGVYSSKWTTNHRLRGIAYVAARYRLYSKTQDLFGAGPPTARFRVKGYKVYDPRLDSTQPGGSGSQRIATPSTWAWSQSPPLCLAHFLCFSEWGPLWDSAWIDWPSFMAAATYCDTTVAIPGSTTEPRFKCNGVLNAGDQHLDNVKKILGCFRGALVPAGDKWRVIAGYQAADLTLTEKDLADTLTMDTEASLIDRFNTVKVTYVDPDNNDVQNEVGGITDATYVARDGGYVLPRQLSIPLCTGFYQAQRLGTLELKLGNQMKVVNFPGNLRALQALAAERVALNIVEWGFSNKNMVVENFEFQDFDGVSLQLREDSSSAYDDMLVGSYSTRGANGVLTPGDETVPAPTSATVTPFPGGNTITWTAPPIGSDAFEEFIVYASATSAWSGASIVYRGRVTKFDHFTAFQRWYWIVAVRRNILSLRLPDSDTSTLTGIPMPMPTRGAPGNFPFVEDFSDNDYTRFGQTWGSIAAIAIPEVIATTALAVPFGGALVLRAGDNSGGNDMSFRGVAPSQAIPIEIGPMYCVVMLARRIAGSGTIFGGVAGLADDKSTVTGGNTLWCAANAVAPGGTTWQVYRGYFKNDGVTSMTLSGTPLDPMTPSYLDPATSFIIPEYVLNYNNATGQAELAYFSVFRVGAHGEMPTDGIAPNAATVVYNATNAGPTTKTYNGGTGYHYLSVAPGIAIDANTDVIATLTTDLEVTATDGTGNTQVHVDLHADWVSSANNEVYNYWPADLNVQNRRAILQMKIPAGTISTTDTTWRVTMFTECYNATATYTLRRSSLIVELVKR